MMALRFHHLGVAVRDLAGAAGTYARLFGFSVLHGPVDDPIQGVTLCFMGTGVPGDVMYELVTRLAGVARSPVDRILERGNTSYHVCYEVPRLEETVARFILEGALHISGPMPAVAFGGRRIAWLLLPTRHLLELLEA